MAATPSVTEVIITAESPLSFSHRKPGGIFLESLGYVPGSALRGAVAATFLPAQHNMGSEHPEDCDFCRRFVDESTAVVFTNAHPVTRARVEAGTDLLEQAEERPRVLPATAVSCKAHTGFLGTRDAHGGFDTLLDRFCWEAQMPAGVVYDPACPMCHKRVERFSGLYVEHRDHQGSPHRHSRRVGQRLLTRVAINRRRGVAEEGMLFSPWALNEAVEPDDHRPVGTERVHERLWPSATFVAWIVGSDGQVDAALKKLGAVGGSASRGLNHVTVEVRQALAETPHDLEQRIARFNDVLDEVWEGYGQLEAASSKGEELDDRQWKGTFFALTLQSDGIFCLPDGRPAMAPTPAVLGLESPVELLRSEAATLYGGGWNAAWGLPKPVEMRVQMGGAYLFHAPEGLTSADYQALAHIQLYGIGLRRAEGFGQVRVCDEFHFTRWSTVAHDPRAEALKMAE